MAGTTGKNHIVCYFIRHGSTLLNEQGRFRGSKKDTPLDAQGIKDAKEVRKLLKNETIGSAYSSYLQRSEDTGRIILGSKANLIPLKDLRPIDVGDYSGEKKSEHKKDIEHLQNHPDEPFPNGESITDFNARVKYPLMRAIADGVRNGIPSLVICHASTLHALGELLHENHEEALVKPGGIAIVTFNGHKFEAKAIFKPKKGSDSHAS